MPATATPTPTKSTATASKVSPQDAAAALAAVCANPKINLSPSKKTASSATFTGTLTMFGLMTIPVKTFKATDEDGVSFNQVHTCTGKDGKTAAHSVQLKQGEMCCPECETQVEAANILKGYNTGNEKAPNFITVTKAEIDAQKPGSDKTMSVTEFIDILDIDPVYYESTEFIAPDKGGEKPFALISKALRATNKVGKGSRVKGGRVQEFVIRPYGNVGLALSYLRTDFEVREFTKWTDAPVTDKEMELAATLIERFTESFTPAKEDAFLANVRRMIEAKSEGVVVTMPTPVADPAVTTDLMAALQASLAVAPARKAAK
jgi:DNA end-binding protein Ku